MKNKLLIYISIFQVLFAGFSYGQTPPATLTPIQPNQNYLTRTRIAVCNYAGGASQAHIIRQLCKRTTFEVVGGVKSGNPIAIGSITAADTVVILIHTVHSDIAKNVKDTPVTKGNEYCVLAKHFNPTEIINQLNNPHTQDTAALSTINDINSHLKILRKNNKDSAKKEHNDSLKNYTKDSAWLSEIKNIINPDSIAVNRWSILGATYANINGVGDDDAPGFTQFYAYVSIPFKEIAGLPDPSIHWVWLRNLYIQPTAYTGGTNNIEFNPNSNTKVQYNYVNKLDVLQYAFLKTPTDLNILTYINHVGSTDYFHAYFDLMGGLLFTKDSVSKSSSTNIISTLSGIHFSAKTESGISKSFNFEGGFQIFWINTISSSISPTLNPQYRHLSDTALQENFGKQLSNGINQPYINADFLMTYNTTVGKVASTFFLHLDYYSNITRIPLLGFQINSNEYHNTYFQIQLGTSVDIGNLFSSGSKNSSTTTSK